MTILNLDELKKADILLKPYPHFITANALDLQSIQSLNADFPTFTFPGLVPRCSVKAGPSFNRLLDELEGDPLRQIVGDKLGVDLSGKPPLITIRGHARSRDGRIHVDTPDKLVSILLYLNPTWTQSAGKLRVLNSNNIADYHNEISPLIGNLFAFKVTEDCWHGHKPLVAPRRAIMINYMASDKAHRKHHNKHKRSALFKRLKSCLTDR